MREITLDFQTFLMIVVAVLLVVWWAYTYIHA